MVNDSAQPWQGELTVERLDFDGTVLHVEPIAFTVQARRVVTSARCPTTSDSPATRGASCWSRRRRACAALWFFARDRISPTTNRRTTSTWCRREGMTAVTVTARELLRDLCLFPDRLDPDATSTWRW